MQWARRLWIRAFLYSSFSNMVTGPLPSSDLLKLNLEPGNGNCNKFSGVIVMPLIVRGLVSHTPALQKCQWLSQGSWKRQIVTQWLGGGLRFCISNKLWGNAKATGVQTTLGVRRALPPCPVPHPHSQASASSQAGWDVHRRVCWWLLSWLLTRGEGSPRSSVRGSSQSHWQAPAPSPQEASTEFSPTAAELRRDRIYRQLPATTVCPSPSTPPVTNSVSAK